MPDFLPLLTPAEAAERLRISVTTLRRIVAKVEEFRGRRMTDFTDDELQLIRDARQCRSMSRAAGPASGTRPARSARAAKASPSTNTAQAVAQELMLKLLRRNETGKSATGSSKAGRPRS